MLNRSYVRLFVAGVLYIAASMPASAHVVAGETEGLIHGFMHPFSGIDHMMAMVAVGMLAAMLHGRALWLVPASFMLMMIVGASAASLHVEVPLIELGISMSVVVFGMAVALQWPLSTVAAMGMAGFFALFHGYAHGAEMSANLSGASYAAGFLISTALLHVTGIAFGVGTNRMAEKRELTARLAGGAVAVVGLFLVT